MAPVRSPGAWLTVLEPKLNAQSTGCDVLRGYYDGKHRVAYASDRFRQAFGGLFAGFADNWCQIVVDAAVERLEVQGFRFGDSGAEADSEAWRMWQDNCLDVMSIQAHTEAVKCGTSFLLVQPGPDGPSKPQITVEHPSEMFVAVSPANRRIRLAALKRWVDEDGFGYAVLYLPDAIYRFRSQSKLNGGTFLGSTDWRGDPAFPSAIRNPLGLVPVVPLENKPDLLDGGQSDLLPGLPLQDAINKECQDMLVASEYGAFIQRWATGMDVPTDPQTGRPLPDTQLKMAASNVVVAPDKDARFGAFPASDLNNYVQAIEMLVAHLAAQTRTPHHYLMQKLVNLSGDALRAAETGLTARVKRKHIDFSDSWEETMRLAFLIQGEQGKGQQMDAETIWGEAESRSEAETVDAAVKKRTSLGYPLETIWESLGESPQVIKRMVTLAGLPDRSIPGVTTATTGPSSPNGTSSTSGVSGGDMTGMSGPSDTPSGDG